MKRIENILFIVPDFYPNSTGFANAAFNLVSVVNSHEKYNVYVFTDVALGDAPEVEVGKIYRYQGNGSGKLLKILDERKKFRCVERIIREQQIDFIFFETNTFTYLQYFIQKKYNEKVFLRLHSTADTEVQVFVPPTTIGSHIKRKLVFDFMDEVHNIICTSDYYLRFVQKYYFANNVYKIWNKKVYGIVHNTVIVPQLPDKRYGGNTFITLGKMSEFGIMQKGISDLIRALCNMSLEGRIPNDFRLLLIGDGREYERLKKFIADLGLEDKVTMIEKAAHEEVFEYISESKAVILLSRFEGQSMFLTEALSAGKPLLISADTGMSDMVIDGVNGFHVRVGDINDISEKLNQIVEMGVEEIEKMGKESLKLYDKKYSNEAVYMQFEKVINLRYRGV